MSVLLKVLGFLPLWFLKGLAITAAWIMSVLAHNKSVAKVSAINLALTHPQLSASELKQLVSISVRRQFLSAVESFYCWQTLGKHTTKQMQNIHNFEPLKALLASRQAVILVAPHIGTWEVMNAWICQYCQPTIMYKPAKTAAINELMLKARQHSSATLVPTDESGVRAIFKTLKQGGVSIILPDHVPEKNGGLDAPFFGLLTPTTTLVSKLAQKVQCPVWSISCIANTSGGFDVYCRPIDSAIQNPDLYTSVSCLNQHIEQLCTDFVADYMWSYKRFRRNPDLHGIYTLPLEQAQQVAQQVLRVE